MGRRRVVFAKDFGGGNSICIAWSWETIPRCSFDILLILYNITHFHEGWHIGLSEPVRAYE